MALHASLKRLLPQSVRGLAKPVRKFLEGPGIETYVLRPVAFQPDPDPAPRLTLILPSAAKSEAFGGVMTALELTAALAQETGARFRVVTEHALDSGTSVLPPDTDHLALADTDWRLPVGAGDVMVIYNWWIALNIEPVLSAQAAHFGLPPRPKLYLIQEYEPHFYAFSAAHMLALQAFNGDWPIWGVFNTRELHAYYLAQGNRADRSFPFEPRMNAKIRPFLDGLEAAEKTRTVLVYGRPEVKRNCFSMLQAGLAEWARIHGPDRRDWRIVSAGEAHAPIALGPHHQLESLGKLPLEAYGKLLRETAVGVSLMSSPHPSYPPLEMAHFGARVVSNAYPGKTLIDRHPNLRALVDIRPEAIAAALEAEIAGFEADPGAELSLATGMPEYLSETPYECLAPLGGALKTLWERDG